VTLLRDEPSIAAALRARWPYISVDEYQDIDATQYALLRLLSAAPGGAGAGGAGLTVIGDPDQAIYGFRGADVGYFLRFAEDYPGATTLPLTRNYRSSPAIVAGALQAIAPSTLVPGRVLRAVATAPPPAAHSNRSDHDRGGSASQKAGNPPRSWNSGPATAITFHEAADEHGEAAWIAEAIDRLLGGSSFHSLDSGRADGHGQDGIGLADIAVLYRTDAQAGPLGQALTRAGLPFQKRSHDLLERRSGVPEIVHEMRLMHADAMHAGASGPPVPASPGTPTAAGALSVLHRLRGAVNRLASYPGGPGSSAVDIRAAGEVLAPLARRCGDDSERFLTEISLGAETDALDPRADAITLLTLHAAKGLEFAIVFVAGCEKGLLPLWLPGMRPETGLDQAEERRLLFVGMTRARTHLLVTCAARRKRHGATADGGPSPFLAAIEPRLLDRSVPASPRRSTPRQLRLL
jgi:DNA helicase-2/ATP-dependent DNA helicase PcrA